MSKTQASRDSYNARRELRLRRDKIAGLIMASFVGHFRFFGDPPGSVTRDMHEIDSFVSLAVVIADTLIERLDSTRKDLAPGGTS